MLRILSAHWRNSYKLRRTDAKMLNTKSRNKNRFVSPQAMSAVDNNNCKTSIAPISLKRIELGGTPSTGGCAVS